MVRDDMTDFIRITCFHCFEEFQVPVEPTEGTTEFVVDCEICCRPMTIRLRFSNGEVGNLEVSGE